jgi:hypothetical protein
MKTMQTGIARVLGIFYVVKTAAIPIGVIQFIQHNQCVASAFFDAYYVSFSRQIGMFLLII